MSEVIASRAGALAIAGVTVRFSGNTVLDDVSFTVGAGTIHALIGPNGAGKSTLFNVISGIYKPRSGSVELDGQRLVGLHPHETVRAGVGRAFQNASMFQSMTVEENILLGRHHVTHAGIMSSGLRLPRAIREERQSRREVRQLAELLDIAHLLELEAGALSYGDAKRVDVARALATLPRLILLDEPAAGMHTHEKIQMRTLIQRIASELRTTVLLVEHDMSLVMDVSEQITVLNFGNVIVTDTPLKIRSDPRVIEAYLGHSSSRDKVSDRKAQLRQGDSELPHLETNG